MEEFKTIKGSENYEETEKRSKFISYAFAVKSEDDVQRYLKEIKSKHWDAKHHVYAYILQNNTEKYSDDGEPSGTGGIPIINAIKSKGLKDVLVIVVRYFGGILLGTSGLRCMYGSGALNVLQKSKIIEMVQCLRVNVCLNYKEYAKISSLIVGYNVKIININYSDNINMEFYIKKDQIQSLLKKASDIFRCEKTFDVIGEEYCAL